MARSAPFRMDLSFSQTSDGATSPRPAEVSNPQSVPAMILRGSPTSARNPLDVVGDHLLVLDVVGGGVDHSGDENHLIGQRVAFEAPVLVRVSRIGHRHYEGADIGLVDDGQDLVERHVEIVGTLVVPPADVKSHPRRIDSGECFVYTAHDELHPVEEFRDRPLAEKSVPLHGEVRGVDLQQQAPVDDVAVFGRQAPSPTAATYSEIDA